MAPVNIIPIPGPLLNSPVFPRFEDLLLLHETFGGLPLPLKHEAVIQVLAFVSEIKAAEPNNAKVVDAWGQAVLGLAQCPSSPGRRVPPGLVGEGFADASCPFTGLTAPVPIVPEIGSCEPSFFPIAHATESGRFVPVLVNPEIYPKVHTPSDGSRRSSNTSGTSSPTGPVPVPRGKATGYFPLQGVKRRSPLASPPVLPPANIMGLVGNESHVDMLIAAHLNAAREVAGIPLLPILFNGIPPDDVPALTSPGVINNLTPAEQAAWNKYYLGQEVTGPEGTKALRLCVGLPV